MNNLISAVVPTGWRDVVSRAATTELAGFAALVIKEWLETREWDLLTCATDAAWVAGAALILNVLLLIALRPRRAVA